MFRVKKSESTMDGMTTLTTVDVLERGDKFHVPLE